MCAHRVNELLRVLPGLLVIAEGLSSLHVLLRELIPSCLRLRRVLTPGFCCPAQDGGRRLLLLTQVVPVILKHFLLCVGAMEHSESQPRKCFG